MRLKIAALLLLVTILVSCKKDAIIPDQAIINLNPGVPPGVVDNEAYDVILVIGQSNTHSGLGLDPILDASDSLIFQVGRLKEQNYQIIPAIEPLAHISYSTQKIGFALTFAKLYKAQRLLKGRKILIIPCGQGDTGFRNRRWNKGNDLYEDAVARTNYVLKYHPNSKMSVMLWHQGEADLNNTGYQEALDAMIINLRKDIKTTSNSVTPLILGGMVPYWVAQDQASKVLNDIIKATTERLPACGFADPQVPFLIIKPNNDSDPTHFDAAGQREMGKRYYAAYLKL